jgi:hypothetical protein
MAKAIRILIGIFTLNICSTLAQPQDYEQKPRIKFEKNVICMSSNEGITFQSDTVYVTFEYYNLNPSHSLSVEFVKPSCSCTGFKLIEPRQKGEKGFIKLMFTKSSIEQFGIIDAIVKSNAINDYELIEVVNK